MSQLGGGGEKKGNVHLKGIACFCSCCGPFSLPSLDEILKYY